MAGPRHDDGQTTAGGALSPGRGATGGGPAGGRSAAGQAALRDAAARTARMLRTVPDGGARVPGLDWTAAETAAHLVGELRFYTGFLTGERDARDYLGPDVARQTAAERNAVANARQLQEFSERDLPRLADALVPAADDYIAASSGRPEGERTLVSNGLSLTVPVMTAALLGEQLIHGLDIARASGAAWTIAPEDANVVIGGVMAMVPDYIDRRAAAGRRVSYELRLRGGPGYRISVDDGAASVTEPGVRADCRISADPVAFLLVGYCRTGQWGQIARGKLMAGGRKPWLGFSFGRLILSP
jgi:uncharacterized protein (TIGR03083 family)